MGIVATKSPYIMGIDLGTSTSLVSVFSNGKPQILGIEGREYMPSVVSYRNAETKLVGEQAKSRALLDPENTVSSIKRYMGEPGYRVKIHGKEYTPEEIAAEILIKLVDEASLGRDFDTNGDLKYAVICIPANFTENAKRATRKAAEIAGIELLYLLEEPVAAAVMYDVGSKNEQKILVYDLGGGTFDVCVLSIRNSEEGKFDYNILSKEGISYLGGDDFDIELMELLNTQFKEQNKGFDLLDTEKEQRVSRKKMKEAAQKLKGAAEKAKLELSEMEAVSVFIPNIIQDADGNWMHLEAEITREQFETAILEMVRSTSDTVRLAIENAKLTIEDIDRIILVGGSTLVPMVKKEIKNIFGKEAYCDFNPRTIVAQGAAAFGASLQKPSDVKEYSEQMPPNNIKITQRATHNLGIMLSGMRFSKIIEKGAEIPYGSVLIEEKVYGTQLDNQTELSILVYQASEEVKLVNERDEAGREKAVCIGEFKLKGIPQNSRGQERINVHFQLNDQNELKVTATSISNYHNSKTVELRVEIEEA